MHPAAIEVEKLLADCHSRRLRRSGPGGQHRNKVETAWWVQHVPTGVAAEANERRSQAENRAEAVFRLRVNLALEVRQPLAEGCGPSPLWRSRCGSGRIEVSASHGDFPALLAEALDVLAACEYDARPAAELLGCTASQLVKLLKKEPRALGLVNAARAAAGLKPLR